MKHFVIASLCLCGGLLAQIYQESGGLVVMEVEETASPLGQWERQSVLPGYSGAGYLQFLGNNFENGPAASPLEFQFQIQQSGLYALHLHCAKETHEGRNDVANDCYVRVEGDYQAGPGPHEGHGDHASLALLRADTKYFGGATDAWKWENGEDSSGGAGNLDPGGHQNKRKAVYDFKAGETYKLIISGRSQFFRLNRIVFRHRGTLASLAQDLETPQSALFSAGNRIRYEALSDFPEIEGGEVPYYRDRGNGALAIAANVIANRSGFARAERAFDGPAGTYRVTLTTMTEEDGESIYRLLVNGEIVATYRNPSVYDPPDSPLDLSPNTHIWEGIRVPSGASIAIESNADTNGEIPEGDGGGTAWARGRWTQIEFANSAATEGGVVNPPPGRLAIVSDGNSPDPDDIGAKAVMFGILNGAGLQDRLVHLSHSCDLDPFSNPGSQTIDAANELRRQEKLHELTGEGIAFYGPFPNLKAFYNCRTDQEAAINDLRDAINASSASDPLWIVEGGEPDLIGYALEAAIAMKRQFVNLISHHPANDNSGDFFTWQEILDYGVTEHQIGDQNVGLQVLISSGLWDWAENHPQAEIAWIWDQLKYAEQDGVVRFQTNKFDCSDAGMVYWWLNGASNGGNRHATPVEMRALLEDGRPRLAELMLGELSDASVKEDESPVDQQKETTLLGAGGRDPWVDRATVFVFRLPDLGEVEQPFASSSFIFDYAAKQGDLKTNDLYGLGRRASAEVLGSDYYGQTEVLDSSDASRLQEGILTNATPLGLVQTSGAGSAALRDYLNLQYDSGKGMGEYVFLRLNTSQAKSGIHRASLTMTEGAQASPLDTRPRISYTRKLPAEENGPVAHWKLDEGSGTLVRDASGNGHQGTLLNGVNWESDETRPTYVSFDGTDDRIRTLFSYALTAESDFTWAWWAKPAAETFPGSIMLGNRFPQGAPGETFEFLKFTPGGAQFSNTDEVAAIERYSYAAPVAGAWHHYAMVKRGTSYQWYVDGVAQGAARRILYDESVPIPFLIGGDDDGSGSKVNEHFEGGIDDVVLYSRALSEKAVQGLREGEYHPEELTQLETWRERYFGSSENQGMAADSADADGDGETNLLEFATGQDPMGQSQTRTPMKLRDGELEFRYSRSKAAVADGVSFLVEWSGSLLDHSWTALGVLETLESEDQELEHILATLPRGEEEKRFVHLRVQN